MPLTRSALDNNAREPGLLRIGADRFGDFTRQGFDAANALGLRAELGMKSDLFELGELRLELRLAVLVPEELGIAQARGDDLVVAAHDLSAAVARDDVGDEDVTIGELAGLSILHREALLVVLDRGGDHFGRQIEEFRIESAHQHDRPFDKAGGLLEQAFILDQFEALRESEIARLGTDRLGTRVAVDDDFGLVELLRVIGEAPRREGFRRHEAMAARDIARGDAVDREGNHFAIERREDRLQGPHPAQGAGAPAHGFGPGKLAQDIGDDLGDDIGREAARLVEARNIEAAFLLVLDR